MIVTLIIFISKPLRIGCTADSLWINSTLFVADFLKLDIYVNNLLALPIYYLYIFTRAFTNIRIIVLARICL